MKYGCTVKISQVLGFEFPIKICPSQKMAILRFVPWKPFKNTHISYISYILLYSHITLGVSLSFSIISTTSTERYTLPAEMWKDARRRGFSGEIFEKPSDHQKKVDMICIYIYDIYIYISGDNVYIHN